ncbi:FlhB domain-containing protein [Campylobacter hyointestinalis]|uniref:YdcH family protein n=1 Tax=Campylobacter hyointestinalis TaxID=198 RepID=UPI000726AE6E|nr:YdcH family protein [Campylobacter hyointestinalis]CUU86897.1 FlhB domain-containing protein [Campylobacter hyointestinalis]
MLHEYRDLITELKGKNARFDSIFEKHNKLDQRIKNIEEGREHADSFELETLKKEKLRLKDEAYAILMEYKNSKAN